MTDEELWGQVRAGVSEAFGQLFERHAQAVFAYCLRRTGTWAVAEDLVSVVFMETWRKRTSVTRSHRNPPTTTTPMTWHGAWTRRPGPGR